MKTYELAVPVEGYEYYTIEAESKEDAIDQVLGGLVEPNEYENNITIDSDNWDIAEVKNEN